MLHRALAQAVRWEWIWLNPASTASPPRVPPAEIRPPSPAEVALILVAARERSLAFAAFLRVAACSGARRGQILGLRWHHLDFDRGTIGFTRSWVDGPDGPVLQATKTHRTHSVDLDTER